MNPAYMACGGWIANAVAAAARLDIAGLLESLPRNAAQLAEATATRPDIMEKLMGLLVATNLFTQDEAGCYHNTEDALTLTDGHPESKRYFCILAAETYQRGFGEIMHTLQTGQPGLEKAFGKSLIAHMRAEPEVGAVYDKAMEDLTRPTGAALAAARDFSGVRRIVDLGGGRGALLRGLLRHLPAEVAGLVFDRPDVCERAAAELPGESPDLVGRLEFRGGDFFAGVPAGGDIYTVKNVLHNWNDAHCVKLLSNARAVMSENARLLIIEPVLDGVMPPLYKALDNLMQTIVSEAGTTGRSEAQLRALAETAGLTVVGSTILKSGQTVIETRC